MWGVGGFASYLSSQPQAFNCMTKFRSSHHVGFDFPICNMWVIMITRSKGCFED